MPTGSSAACAILPILLGLLAAVFGWRTVKIAAFPIFFLLFAVPLPGPLVDIVTQNAGQSSEEIERYISIPIEVQMAGLPYVTSVRSISLNWVGRLRTCSIACAKAASRNRRRSSICSIESAMYCRP